MPAKWQKIKVDLSGYGLTSDEKDEVADLIVERIVNRTQQGLDINGRPWRGKAGEYSQAYRDSLDFKIAGKSKSKVDLQLSGDMLAALEVLDKTQRSVTIGFENGSDENAKADGNIRGTYGRSEPIKGKARDFLGINLRDLKNIINEVKKDNG